MFKELAVLLGLWGLVSAGHLRHPRSASYSTTASPLQVTNVQPQNAIPLEAKILQSQLAVETYSPATYPFQNVQNQVVTNGGQAQVSSPGITYSISPAVVKTISVPGVNTVGERVTVEAHQHVTAHQPTVNQVSNRAFSQPIVVQPLQNYVQSISQAQTVPVTAPPTPVTIVTSTLPPQPFETVTQAPVIAVPVEGNKVTVEAHRSITVHPPSVPQPVQTIVNPGVQIVSNSVAPTSVPQVQTIVHPANQHSSGSVSYPVSSTVVTQGGTTIVRQDTTHTAPAKPVPVIYSAEEGIVDGTTIVRQVAPNTPGKPIPVPVIFSAEEAQPPNYVTKYIQPSSSIINQTPVTLPQSVALPLAYTNTDYFNFNPKVSTPLAYSKSFVSPDHFSSDFLSTQFSPSFGDYSRALVFSPASEVSRVSFNGLGVSYGW